MFGLGVFLWLEGKEFIQLLVNKFLLNREDIIKMKLAEIGFDTG
jgi:hypothetical protein